MRRLNGIYSLLKLFLRIDQRLQVIITILSRLAELEKDHLPAPVKEVWFDNQEVMFKIKISESTLKRHRRNNTIPCTRIKGKYYYKLSDIEKLLQNGR